ncbi:acyl carrier protein [Singulisphaera acidiphila]|uniref:Acyl carrier protein n=1 Tax=Singulisphaera acidiphila (strain ATCC BAA-1392 / DSM 18658 / VKM B-2454 / MOB10) TaxID=886293 RepID=L0DCJ6_SINAD|nr:acyl carrier protein [Singulisphaera acidiphila]AGA26563.1 acyl carrier protein [Singulisphaera acidiphila DSM 18658]
MNDSNLLAEITSIVRQAGRIPNQLVVTAESRMVEDLNIDSLDLVNVVLKVQDHFDVVIDDEDMPNLRRVSDLAAFVAERRGSAAA